MEGQMSKASWPALGRASSIFNFKDKVPGTLWLLWLGRHCFKSIPYSQPLLTSTEYHFTECSVYSTMVFSKQILPGRNFCVAVSRVKCIFHYIKKIYSPGGHFPKPITIL